MSWKHNIERWRKLSPQQQREVRLRALPRKVANSMAFEGEPVDLDMLERELARQTARDAHHADSEHPPNCVEFDLEKKGMGLNRNRTDAT